jgi:transposase
MSSIDYYSSKLINLKGFCVENFEICDNEINIYGKMELKEHTCPCCGHKTTKVHDYRNQKIKDISMFAKQVYIVIKKRRYVCSHCNKRFMENITFLPKYQRRTVRLTHFIIDKLRDVISFSYLSREVNLSVSTVIRIFDAVQYPKPDMPKVIGIDEFKGNTGCEKYQCILTDIENHKVIDILPNRFEYSLIDYFKDLKRDDTKYFVSDMWRTYANIAHTYFKKAIYVIDKYHFVRQVSWAFESVRKEAQRKFNKQRRIYFKRSKKLLLKRYDDLDAESKEAVRVMLNADEALYKAYWLKEDFYDIMKSQSKEEAKKKISDWILQAENSQIVRFSKCADTMRNWFQAICNSFDCAYTNGFTEGCNNKIKVLKRNAYGYRNFSRLRNRILHIFA